MTEGEREETTPELEEESASEPALEEEAPEEACKDEVASLEEKLIDAEKKIAEYLDGWQRCQATFANYRKRTEAEQVSWRSVANAALLSRLLPIADDFDRAFQALPADFEGHAWLEGFTLIRRKVDGILESENVQPIDLEPGDEFDPLYHQAVFYQEAEGFEEGQIVAEVERGYILGDRVLRPSSVVVAKAPAKAPAQEPVIEVEGEVIDETAESGKEDACRADDSENSSGSDEA